MKKNLVLVFIAAIAACSAPHKETEPTVWEGIRYIPLQWERLPDMNHPRAGHVLLPVGGEVLAAGGHTTGFITEPTAEYFRGGRWTEIPMLYAHDTPFCLPMKDGSLMLGGGYGENFGIGQSWGTERYNPSTHSFSPTPILDRKRAHASAVELSGGRIIISGNWYQKDGIASYVPGYVFEEEKSVSEDRSYPYILRSDVDNVIVFSSRGCRFEERTGLVDRLRGDTFEEPLLRQWKPFHLDCPPRADECFIGDLSTGHYYYLVCALDSTGRMAPILIRGENFTLLETEHPIPTEGPWGPVRWTGYPKVQRSEGVAWLCGQDTTGRAYLLKIGYDTALKGEKAPIVFYYTEPLEGLVDYPWDCLLPDEGQILIAGGTDGSNYEPTAAAFLLSPTPRRDKGGIPWLPLVLVLALGVGGASGWVLSRKKAGPPAPAVPVTPDMMTRILRLMEEKQLFRRSNLRLQDLATELGTNVTYISACINGQTGKTFPEFVSAYRIRYAQKMMQDQPDKLLSEVGLSAGFANDKSFFRTFKASTGMTPSEWKINLSIHDK